MSKLKQSRDSLRMDNGKLKQNSGLLGNNVLLRDFEECVDKNDNLEGRIEHLKRKHAELILSSKGIKQKIAQTKTEKPIVWEHSTLSLFKVSSYFVKRMK